jgi:cytochrome c oxidase subunit 2
MRKARRILGTLAGVAVLAALAEPAAAQSSVNEELIFGLNRKLLYVAVPITVLVEAILIYTVYRFRNSDEAQPTRENRRLEITWTVATAIILLFVGLASYQVLGSSFIGGATAVVEDDGSAQDLMPLTHDYPGAQAPSEENAVQVDVEARKYAWTFTHENNASASGNLVIPANTPVYLHVTSVDWLHAFHAPDLALKQDAFPGQYNTIKTEVYETGTYQLYCAEYCGVGHSGMLGTIEVVSQEEYQQYLEENAPSAGENASGNATAGNATAGNATGNATAGNATGNATAGNATGNATAGNATAGNATGNATTASVQAVAA